jgi:hypothetical protein
MIQEAGLPKDAHDLVHCHSKTPGCADNVRILGACEWQITICRTAFSEKTKVGRARPEYAYSAQCAD